MRTELTKYFSFGFVLMEAELRRIVGVAEEQIRKLPGQSIVKLCFEMKFKDGAVVKVSSLDEVLTQENLGSSQIIKLKIECFTENGTETNYISINFINLDIVGNFDDEPINFEVRGESRDWTLVTSSLLDERIKKIKRNMLELFFGRRKTSRFSMYSNLAMVGLIVFISVAIIYDRYRPLDLDVPAYEEPSLVLSISNDLEKEIKAKNIKDPIEVIILRDKILEERESRREADWKKYNKQKELDALSADRKRTRSLLYLPLFVMIPPFTFYVIRKFLLNYYPAYNFCWGDYAEVFQRKEAVRKFVTVVIFIGIIVSFVGGILANITGLGK
jgi:hypothetical protein